MKIRFLGTGTSQGVPIIACDCAACSSKDSRDQRLRTSVLFQINDLNLVIDTGPDFRQQMLQSGISDLHAVLLTHEHNDHIIGMDDVRPFNFRAEKDMPVYATEQVQNELKKRFAYIFAENSYPGAPRLQLHSITAETPFFVENVKVIPIEVMHGRLPVLGFRIDQVTYITDAKTITDKELAKIKGSEILVINALHHHAHHSHMNLDQAIDLAQTINAKQTYLTHISHRMGPAKTIDPILPEGIQLAFDGLELTI